MEMSEVEPKRRILIAEDVRTIALTVSGILKGEGFETAVAEDGEDCLTQVGDFKPDLVILDLLMPKLHGIDVLKRLKSDEETRDIGVILSTTKDFDTEFHTARDLGAFGMMNKPVDRNELIDVVTRFFQNMPLSEVKRPCQPIPTGASDYKPQLDQTHGAVKMWGTRGSIPVSGVHHSRYGGNTSCMQFTFDPEDPHSNEAALVFDAGSGIREAGDALMKNGRKRIHLFITHTHWDHIQGFPFFTPIHDPDTEITVYGDRGFGGTLESVLCGQLAHDYFPVQWDDIKAKIEFQYLTDEPITIGEATVSREFVNHPGATVAYRIEYRDRSTVYMPDNEFLQGYLGPPDELEHYHELLVPHLKIINFVKDADVLIHEAQYTAEEYPSRIGWGHSSLSNACILVKRGGVKRWLVTHHDPAHIDEFLDSKAALTRQVLHSIQCHAEYAYARDGTTLFL